MKGKTATNDDLAKQFEELQQISASFGTSTPTLHATSVRHEKDLGGVFSENTPISMRIMKSICTWLDPDGSPMHFLIVA